MTELSPEKIADLLLEDMLVCKDEFGWIGIHYSPSGKIYPGFIDLYLYNGLCGIAIFFAALCKQNTAERYSHIYRKLIETLFEHTDKACSGNLETDDKWGLFTGETSFVYTYLILHEITGKDVFLDYATKHGSVPLAGMAHGSSGIALAFAYLYRYTHKLEYLETIKDAILYEDSLYDAEKRNWMDLRNYDESKNDSGDTVAWCHGAAGILAARMTIWRMTGLDKRILFGVTLPEGCNTESYGTDGMMKRLTAKIRETKKGDMCLCHGNLGLLEILNDCLNGAGIRYNGCPERMNITYNDFRDWDSECDGLSLEDRNNPGFMVGLSGVGYALLRERERKLPGVFVFGFTEAQTQIVKNMIARGGCRMKSNHAS